MGKIVMKSRTGVPVPPSNSCTRNLRLALAASKGLFGQAVKNHNENEEKLISILKRN